MDHGRREFLIRCCQSASVAAFPASLRALSCAYSLEPQDLSSAGSNAEFHLHPHYRAQMPLDATLLETKPGFDRFVTEKYHDQIAEILARWSSSSLNSASDMKAFGEALATDFLGCSLRPVDSRIERSDKTLEVRRNTFPSEAALGRDAFLAELQGFLGTFANIVTAEFQVTSIDARSQSSSALAEQLRTRVRYELVGSGRDFYREQRVGAWDLEWVTSASFTNEFRIRKWRVLNETQSRSLAPFYVDTAAQALGGNVSYSSQLLRGADYWRTVFDGACGIDIYGNNGVSVGDIDGDGFDDLYVCQPAGLPNRLYRNRGDGTFEDITEKSGLGILDNTSCALFADFDNDGRQDLIVVCTNGPLLFLNEAGGKFRRKPDAFQFSTPPQGTFTGAAVADYDRDGWLDIYFCLYLYYQGTDQYNYPS
ncbi:MAG: ASPIC/UnbV domain protein, partial [Acidobacteriaceae bacterium]|nr:ASPIC/UnbV domain protein [Acidobacteriaceae bacterium]